MTDAAYEQLSAKKKSRLQVYIEAKEAYEEFVQDMAVSFDRMTQEHYLRAQADPRILKAEQHYTVAIDMSDAEGEIQDAAVARYQLGTLHLICGRLERASKLIRDALGVMANLPNRDCNSDMSACYYRLGIIDLKQGRFEEAVRALRYSRQIDRANTDIAGIQACDLALAACAEAGADINQELPPPCYDAGSWDPPESDIEPAEVETTIEYEIKTGPVRYNHREIICVASHSVQANDSLVEKISLLGDEFGRPVSVTCVAFGSSDPAKRRLSPAELDQHYCATILILEKQGLYDRGFRELAAACMQQVISKSDFRLLVHLHDVTIEELRDLSDHDPLIAMLFDTTQIPESPSFEQLRRTLVPYIRQVEKIQAASLWRTIRLRLAILFGRLTTVVLVLAVSLAMLGFPVWLLDSKMEFIGPHAPKLASLVMGILAFPLQAPLIFFLLRGMRAVAFALKDNNRLRPWVFVGAVITLGAGHLQHGLDGPYSWLFLGLAAGVLLDWIRRAGRRAQRQAIDIEAWLKRADDSAMSDPKTTVLRGDPLNPFYCPLLPSLSTEVFISYTRSSARSSRLATALHRDLKKAGVSPFLDRASIQSGASWRREINDHLGKCDTFICILDEKSLEREWVAAELLTAIEAHGLTSSPKILILVDPAIQNSFESKHLPIFRGVISASTLPAIPGRPQIIAMNSHTRSALAWGLVPRRFMPNAVFTRMASRPIYSAMAILGGVAGLGIITGHFS